MMPIEEIPIVGPLLAAGADDRVFDAFLLLGPPAILAVAVLGRTATSIGIAVAYTGGFFGYVVYNGLK